MRVRRLAVRRNDASLNMTLSMAPLLLLYVVAFTLGCVLTDAILDCVSSRVSVPLVGGERVAEERLESRH